MDILNERTDDWSKRDWDNMPVERVEALATEGLDQVNALLADPNYVFTQEIGKRLVRRLKNDLAWVCQKNKRGLLHRELLTAAYDVAKRANIRPPGP